ncbi:MAG: hypothetical protein Q7R41_10130 [Phycisphaerales bacterium]|nr:hypothetical protein [Phycisphaerales bacterium]
MAQDQKQKVLITLLAVFALGAGSYFFIIRDSGGGAQVAASAGPAERRVRKESTEATPKRREPTRQEPTAEPAEPVRRERDVVEPSTTGPRRERKPEKDEVKKAKLPTIG